MTIGTQENSQAAVGNDFNARGNSDDVSSRREVIGGDESSEGVQREEEAQMTIWTQENNLADVGSDVSTRGNTGDVKSGFSNVIQPLYERKYKYWKIYNIGFIDTLFWVAAVCFISLICHFLCSSYYILFVINLFDCAKSAFHLSVLILENIYERMPLKNCLFRNDVITKKIWILYHAGFLN